MSLGLLQHGVERLELRPVGGALRDAHVQRGHRQNLALAVAHVDLARKRLRRIEEDVGRVDVAVISVAVDREGCGAPLAGDRVLAARAEIGIGSMQRG